MQYMLVCRNLITGAVGNWSGFIMKTLWLPIYNNKNNNFLIKYMLKYSHFCTPAKISDIISIILKYPIF